MVTSPDSSVVYLSLLSPIDSPHCGQWCNHVAIVLRKKSRPKSFRMLLSCLFIVISCHPHFYASSLPILVPLLLLERSVIPFCLACLIHSWVPIDITSPESLSTPNSGLRSPPRYLQTSLYFFHCLLFHYPDLFYFSCFPHKTITSMKTAVCLCSQLYPQTLAQISEWINTWVNQRTIQERGTILSYVLKIRLSYLVTETCLTGTSDKRILSVQFIKLC